MPHCYWLDLMRAAVLQLVSFLTTLIVYVTAETDVACGVVKETVKVRDDRIVGGLKALPDQYPWIAYVVKAIDEKYAKSCAASIISDRWLITAAHCCVNLK